MNPLDEDVEYDGITLLELIGADALNKRGVKMSSRRCTALTATQTAAVSAYWTAKGDIMTMVPRDKTSEEQIAAAKVMPSGRTVDNAGNPIDSYAVEQALGVPSGGKKGTK